jgi:hypothetical protein
MGEGARCHDPAALLPGIRPDARCVGGWMGPKASLDLCGKSRPHRNSILETSSPYRVAIFRPQVTVKSAYNCIRGTVRFSTLIG